MPARWGQNFLADAAWSRRVADSVAPRAGESIIEIGGGRGDLSALLADSGCRLTIIEIDPRLAADLESRFAGRRGVRVIAGDVLAVDWEKLITWRGPPAGPQRGVAAESRPRLIGNLPYYITGPILARYFHRVELFGGATFMVQREIAERLTAAPGHEYGRLSAAAQFFCQPRRWFDVPPGAFRPKPKVWSSLVDMPPAEPTTGGREERERFLEFLRLAFGQKRKRLENNLKASYAAEGIEAAMAGAGIMPGARAEDCGAETLWRLFRALEGVSTLK